MKISINDHSSVRIESSKVMYFDPFNIMEESNDADLIFITHAHFDHFSPEYISKVAKDDTTFVMPESMLEDATDAGIDESKIVAIDVNDNKTILGFDVKTIPAYTLDKDMHPKGCDWVGYVVNIEGKSIYVAGDIDAIEEAEALDVDIAFLPIGGTYTMNYTEAANMVNRMKPKKVIPYHYGTMVGPADAGEQFKKLVEKDIEVELYI